MKKLRVYALLLTTTLSFSGCVIAPKFPELPPSRDLDCPAEVRLGMLPAIPKTVHIVIDGDRLETDAGGEALLRNYAATRKLIKELWHSD